MLRLYALSIILWISTSTIAADSGSDRFIVFFGNPGTGKSTLINSLVDQRVMQSGSGVVGLTKHCQKVKYNGVTLIDTPGLADVQNSEQAALEIEKSLKLDGAYKIFFVMNLNEGRIVNEDCETINVVMKAIDGSSKFHIIINKLSEEETDEIFNEPKKYKKFCRLLDRSLTVKPSSITLIDFDQDVKAKKKAFLNLDYNKQQFILEQASDFHLSPNRVKKILTKSAEIKELKEEEQTLTHKVEEQRNQLEKKRFVPREILPPTQFEQRPELLLNEEEPKCTLQ